MGTDSLPTNFHFMHFIHTLIFFMDTTYLMHMPNSLISIICTLYTIAKQVEFLHNDTA